MKHYMVLSLLLAAAMACYVLGIASSAIALLAAGVLLELGFWYSLIRRYRGRSQAI
jgi:hypothetical protein